MLDVRTLTKQQFDEYVTKAMLLDAHYDWRFHTFYPLTTAATMGSFDFPEPDADTLEMVEAVDRRGRAAGPSCMKYNITWEGLQAFIRDEAAGITHVPVPPPRGDPGGNHET